MTNSTNRIKKASYLTLCTAASICIVSVSDYDQAVCSSFLHKSHPFSYDLGVKIIPSAVVLSTVQDSSVTICCHGYGGSNRLVNAVNKWRVISGTLLGFNFPDYNRAVSQTNDYKPASFGTEQEIGPLLYVMQQCINTLDFSAINLYGFSAGGGAIINALVALNTDCHDAYLEKMGITSRDKKNIINAVERGFVLLDCPLKSVEEIMSTLGATQEMIAIAKQYKENKMRPLDTISLLKGMHLTVFVYYEVPDDILGNHSDVAFAAHFRKANAGITKIVSGTTSGHNGFHALLWDAYHDFKRESPLCSVF